MIRHLPVDHDAVAYLDAEFVFLQTFIADMCILEFEILYFTAQNQGFSSILDMWREHSVTLGQEVKVSSFKENFEGVAKDIDEEGALLVETATGMRRVLAGDVSVRSLGG